MKRSLLFKFCTRALRDSTANMIGMGSKIEALLKIVFGKRKLG
jgi:hypothetical protein